MTPLAGARDADHARTVTVAPVGVRRRPGAGLQPLIGVDRRRSETGQRIGVLKDPAQEPASHLGERNLVLIASGQILLAGLVPKTEVYVEAASGPVAVGLGHEGRDIALLARQIADRVLEREIVVDSPHRIRMAD